MSRPRSAGGAVEVVWPGKYGPDGQRVEVPARTVALEVEQVIGGGEAEPARAPGLLIGGDNLLAMDALMATHAGTIDLVYIDPPFATGHEFERTTRVGADAEGPELRSRAYSDRWPGGVAGLLQMLDPRLRRIHRLLAPHGSLYVHVDPIVGHAVKLLLDEIFGPGCFQREIVWRVGWISGFKARANNWIRNHDLIYFYVKDPQRFVFHRQVNPHPEEYRRRKGEGDQQGGVPVEDVWNASPAEWRLRGPASLDSIQIKSFSREKTGWATQKNESLLRRIVAASSDEGALVADFFCGAGTTLAAAHALGRRWIGCDSAAAAVELAHVRMAEKTGASFVRAGLGPGEREIWLAGQAEAWPLPVLRRRAAQVAELPLSGIVGDTGLLVGPLAGAVAASEVAAAVASAAALGLRRLEVLAWAWAFPAGIDLSQGTGVEVVCLQLRRALLDPRGDAGEAPWSERPVVAVAFAVEATEAGPRVRATLVSARFSAPSRASAALQASDDPRAGVEAWSLAIEEVPGSGEGPASGAGPWGPELAGVGGSGEERGDSVARGREGGREPTSGDASGAGPREPVATSSERRREPAAGDDAGAVDEGCGRGPYRPLFAAARTRNRRELDGESGWLELVGAGPWTARVRVVDVLGGESWHAWRIEHVLRDLVIRACV
ncbi:site-specific DNA-methyltransferase [Nannocystis sp. SCPEA4]|uniref:site-specific DNA-methyltransferase n=1 Tax=Nannocystis sp. SCPEA4 TaxID=2996787 RepID=UPI0022713D35|nr:site-specific DNA-methyltransferase [Nannocystis sp. SCPEA4]MCY1057917.1 site-specific DNA-methyltransferase [Nannocystis sp. SCPEA4]